MKIHRGIVALLALTCASASAAGEPSGAALRGTELRKVTLVEAADAYVLAFSLGELDDTLGRARVLLCWQRNGQALDAHEGPLRLIVPGDSRARSVRQVVRIRVVDPTARGS